MEIYKSCFHGYYKVFGGWALLQALRLLKLFLFPEDFKEPKI